MLEEKDRRSLPPGYAGAEAAGAPTLVVGIGASAGGLEALREFFGAIEEGAGMAFVVVAHLEPSSKNLLPELLAQQTPLPITELQEGQALVPNHIFVAPPNFTLELDALTVRLSSIAASDQRRTPIDAFFRSLADAFGPRAVGVVLSGAGSDGTTGVQAIANAGGMTMVQDPELAKYDSMPRSALLTAVVDHALSAEQLAHELLAYVGHVEQTIADSTGHADHEGIAHVLGEICDLLQRATEHNFKHYKTTTMVRRIQRRMQVLRIAEPQRYVDALRSQPDEVSHLFRELLIGVTSFFRDADAFECLASEVIRPLVQRGRGEQLRFWVPGCATGEEAYSLAMIVREVLDTLSDPPEVQVFATDIDERALSIARQGLYPSGVAEHIPKERLDRFFIKKGKRYQVKKEIRELCLFSPHNLINDPPFSRLDLISCRNLLIYFGPHLQKKLIPLFHYALRPNGYLFLGPSENISSHKELFVPINAKHRISQRKATAINSSAVLSGSRGYRGLRPIDSISDAEPDLQQLMQRILLDEFAPKSVVVTEEGQIVSASGDMARYLTVTEGTFQNNVVRLARPGLRVGLRAALNDAIKVRRKVVHDKVSVQAQSGIQRVRLTVQPMPRAGEEADLFMIVFQDLGMLLPRDETSGDTVSAEADSLIEQLERELSSTRDDLEKTIQDLEAANEELKSSNEELLSMNEELQSANEELETSKEEVQATNEALARAHANLSNLLTSTAIATIFLDDALNIQSFTPAIAAVYNVLPTDIGRPLAHITHRSAKMPDLPVPSALRSASGTQEDDVVTEDGHWYLRRALPYHTHEGRAEGMVVTFIDVTALKNVEAIARRHEQQLEASAVALDEAKRAAEEANRAKSDFLANMSHEIRTPMMSILGYAELLHTYVTDPDNLACVDAIRRNGHHLIEIINDILDLSKIEARMLRTEQTPFSPGGVLRDVVDALRLRAAESGLTLHLIHDGLIPATIESDPTKLRQILINLVGNAIKFTETGEVRIVAKLREAERLLEVSVIDTGVGIPAEQIATLFEPFTQGDGSHTRRYGGTGLGLAISKRLVEALGGSMTVESTPGRGSVFSFTVATGPLDGVPLSAEVPEPVSSPLAPAARLNDHRVLVVDDRRDMRYLIQSYIEEAGASVTTAANAAQAIERVTEAVAGGKAFTAITLDMQMPGMDGLEAAPRLRSAGHTGTIIALTANAMKGYRERCLAAGCDAYIPKPADRLTLINTIAHASTTRASEPVVDPGPPATFEPDVRILIADDQPDALDMLATYLETHGLEVVTAANGAEAVAKAASGRFNAVVLDIGLPDMDGFAVIEHLKQIEALRSTTFIALTGRGSSEEVQRMKEAGFNHHFLKPPKFDELVSTLKATKSTP